MEKEPVVLTDGLILASAASCIVQEVGRTPEEAKQEVDSKLQAFLNNDNFTPRGCIYNPHRDY